MTQSINLGGPKARKTTSCPIYVGICLILISTFQISAVYGIIALYMMPLSVSAIISLELMALSLCLGAHERSLERTSLERMSLEGTSS